MIFLADKWQVTAGDEVAARGRRVGGCVWVGQGRLFLEGWVGARGKSAHHLALRLGGRS
jgi:hypothetical protein